MNRHLTALLFILSLSAAAVAETTTPPLARVLDQLFDTEETRNARWGVYVVNMSTSETLYERDIDKSFLPASNMKLYTTAAALAEFGADHKFETTIHAAGRISEGTLRGDLIVTGSGDPSISGRYNEDLPTTAILDQWADAVRAAGIRRVTGAVIGDGRIFTRQGRAGNWQVDYLQYWYAAESSGLAINDNCWDAWVLPGPKAGAAAKIEPWIPTRHVKFVNSVVTTEPAERRSNTDISFTRAIEDTTVEMRGHIAVGADREKMWGAVTNGNLFTATLFAEALRRKGVTVTQGARDAFDVEESRLAPDRPNRKLIHTHESLPMSRLLAIINKPSQNFYADQLLKALGARKYGQGTFSAGERAVKEFLDSIGVPSASLIMSDGSGLSRGNQVEPRQTMAILRAMADRPDFDVFFDSLPVAGVDGTIRSRLRETPLEGKLQAKTGFIGRVRALSGYLTHQNGDRIAFSMMANQFVIPVTRINDAQDSAALAIAGYLP